MTSKKPKLRLTLTEPQYRVVKNLYQGLEPNAHLVGRSAHGGFARTWRALRLAGFTNTAGGLTNRGIEAFLGDEKLLNGGA